LTPAPPGTYWTLEAEFLFMDGSQFFCKIIKDKGDFLFETFLFQPNRTKNKEMRGKNQKPYHHEQHCKANPM
jgi:hypothetical protein